MCIRDRRIHGCPAALSTAHSCPRSHGCFVSTAATAQLVPGPKGHWFIDNSAALATFVKGRSNNTDQDRISSLFHLACAELRVTSWFEYVESDSNWSDNISRHDRSLVDKLQFPVTPMPLPAFLFQGSLAAAWDELRSFLRGEPIE